MFSWSTQQPFESWDFKRGGGAKTFVDAYCGQVFVSNTPYFMGSWVWGFKVKVGGSEALEFGGSVT